MKLKSLTLFIFGSMVPLTAISEIRTFDFTGTITVAQGSPFGATVAVGDAVSGRWQFDTTVPPNISGQSATYLQDTNSTLEAVVGGVVFSTTQHDLIIGNDDPEPFGGQLGALDYYGAGSTSFLVDGTLVNDFLNFFSIGGDDIFNSNGNGADAILSSNSLADFEPEAFNPWRQVLFIRETGSILLEADIVLTEVILSPEEGLADLANLVMEINIGTGISNALDSKIDAALAALDDLNNNNDVAAINSIYAFCNSVEAQRDKQISDEDASSLIQAANEVIALIDENAMLCN